MVVGMVIGGTVQHQLREPLPESLGHEAIPTDGLMGREHVVQRLGRNPVPFAKPAVGRAQPGPVIVPVDDGEGPAAEHAGPARSVR